MTDNVILTHKNARLVMVERSAPESETQSSCLGFKTGGAKLCAGEVFQIIEKFKNY